MIYVFIAASYFPWLMLGPIGGDGVGSQLWWLIWVLAFCGILYQQLFHERYKTLETVFYCFMAIAPALAIIPEVCFIISDVPLIYYCTILILVSSHRTPPIFTG